jgi:hypothetical protein
MRTLVIVVAICAATPASADRAKAEQYFRAGATAFRNQSFGAAAENFELAYKEEAIPEIAFSAAQAYRREYYIQPKPEYVQRAVALYRAYLDKVHTGGRVGDASDGLAEMKRELDRLTAQGAKFETVQKSATRFAISVAVPGEAHQQLGEVLTLPASDPGVKAKATLDGQPVDMFVPVDVTPGQHVIEVTAPGYFPVKLERVAVDGATDVVEAELQPRPAHLAIRVEDGARVEIDGKPVGSAPLAVQDVASGHHLVKITRRGREPVIEELTLARDQQRALDVHLARTGKRRAVPWLLGGAGLLAIGSGVATGFALSADSKLSSLEHQRDTTGISTAQLAELQHEANRRDGYRDLALGLGGGALAAGAIAAAFYWFDTPEPGERGIVPVVTGGGAGFTVVGRF